MRNLSFLLLDYQPNLWILLKIELILFFYSNLVLFIKTLVFSGERQEIWTIQEEPPEDFLKKGVLFLLDDIGRSRKLCHIHWKTPVLQSLFNRVAGLQAWISGSKVWIVFVVCTGQGLSKYVKTKLLPNKTFLINKNRSGTSLPTSFYKNCY